MGRCMFRQKRPTTHSQRETSPSGKTPPRRCSRSMGGGNILNQPWTKDTKNRNHLYVQPKALLRHKKYFLTSQVSSFVLSFADRAGTFVPPTSTTTERVRSRPVQKARPGHPLIFPQNLSSSSPRLSTRRFYNSCGPSSSVPTSFSSQTTSFSSQRTVACYFAFSLPFGPLVMMNCATCACVGLSRKNHPFLICCLIIGTSNMFGSSNIVYPYA